MIKLYLLANLLVAILPGEVLKYDVRYGFIRAGVLTISVSRDTFRGEPAYRITLRLKSNPSFERIYSLRDEFRSIVDTGMTHSLLYVKKVREGKYRLDLSIFYVLDSGYVRYSNGKLYRVEHNVFDPLGAIFAVREKELRMGDTLKIPYHIDGITSVALVYPLKLKKIKLRWGKCEAFKIEPEFGKKGLLKGRTVLWMARAWPHVPILIEAYMPFGKLSAKLIDYELNGKKLMPSGVFVN